MGQAINHAGREEPMAGKLKSGFNNFFKLVDLDRFSKTVCKKLQVMSRIFSGVELELNRTWFTRIGIELELTFAGITHH